jgi:PAS domain S-box-containing protein
VSIDFQLDEEGRAFYEIAPCGYVSTRADGTFVRVNQTFLNWTGYQREQIVLRKRFQDLLTTPGKIFYETQYVPLLNLQSEVKEVAFDLICHNRPPLPILINSTQRRGGSEGQEILIHGAFFDATDRRKYERELLGSRKQLEDEVRRRTADLELEVLERRRTEENLQQLTAQLLTLRDDERRALARELHDSVGQMIVAMSMNLAVTRAESAKLSPKAASALSENSKLISEISAEIRTISHLLHPPLLDEVGLTFALTWYVEGLAQRANMKISLEVPPGLPRLPQTIELAIFRIVQECMTNVYRHSGSKTASVRITLTPEIIRVEVQDNGSGISSEKMSDLKSSASGVGLRGMRERVKQLRGALEISSNRQGTLVVATISRTEVTS